MPVFFTRNEYAIESSTPMTPSPFESDADAVFTNERLGTSMNFTLDEPD